ncbi:MAG: YggT family protein [Candidatus Omnitrophica bacterium]|nr:YggT family protein [Candidatus Omnitrophota bacterium]
MFILSNFLASVARLLEVALTIFYWLMLIRCLISWVNPDPYNSLVQFLYKVTEPVLAPIRRVIPMAWGIGFDLSPLIAFLLLLFLQSFLVRTLLDLAARIR